MTYDGESGAGPHWVDRAPGGVTPAESAFGADYVVGACGASGPGGSPGGGTATTAVALDLRRRLAGGGRAEVSGRVTPARAGVPVAVTATAGARARVRHAVTQADGTFALLLPFRETSRVRAVAEGIGSQTRTITVVSRVRIALRRGGRLVKGRVRPALPGRVLLLRGDAVAPVARVGAHGGRFRIRLHDPRPGRYQAVFVPAARRAERSTSNTEVIR